MNEQTIKQIKASQTKSKKVPVKAYEKPVLKIPVDDSVLKPQGLVPQFTNRMIALGVFLFTIVVYMMTQARTMSFWDSGEYATCGSILGVPHAPGNPFYIVFSRAMIALFGNFVSHAMISAFISCLTSALAVMFTYLMTVQFVSMFKVKAREAALAGIVAALYTAFSFTFWMNAVEAEVYSGLVFFVNLIIWLTLVWVQKSEDYSHQNILLLIVYLFFLGFCVHQTALQIAPAMLFIVFYPLLQKGVKGSNFWLKVLGYTFAVLIGYLIFGAIGKGLAIDDFDKWGFALIAFLILFYELRDVVDKRVWGLAIALVFVGLSAHLYLMIRAADRPFINEGQPSTLTAFQDYVLRKQYGNTSFLQRRGNFFTDQIGHHFLRYFGMQWFQHDLPFGIKALSTPFLKYMGNMFIALLGLFGGIFHYRMNRHSFRYFLSILLLTTIVMVFVMNLSNAEVRDRDYFFVVGYNMWAVWLGIGALGIVKLWDSKAVRAILIAIMLILPLSNMVSQYHIHDRSKEYIALDYGLNFLNSLEENAIIFTNGDNDTFPLWYAQAVADPNAKENIFPAKDVYPTPESQAAIKQAMAYKNQCLKGIRKDVSVANLSLLNTAWYIRQLRDKEGILFSIPDDQLDKLSISELDETLTIPGPPAKPEMGFSMKIPSTAEWRKDEPFYRVSDLAVMQIIKDNFGKRPIYFAVTCESYINFEDYTRNEGMVARVVSTPGNSQVDITRLLKNIDQVYEYRSISDKKVYKDDNMTRLVMNYGSGFVRAANYFVDQKQYATALSYVEKAKRFIDNDIKLTEFYTNYYASTGQWTQLDDFIKRVIVPHPDGWKIYISYIMSHLAEKYPDKSLEYLKKGMLYFPDQQYFAQLGLEFAKEYNDRAQVLAIFNEVRAQLTYDIGYFESAIKSDSLNYE